MSFKSLHHILSALEEQNRWQEQPFQLLLKSWPEAVGAIVMAHTRPLSIQRSVLVVATSSAAWAQTLTLGRQRILEKLNVKLPSPLVDIRFSTAQWQRPKVSNLSAENQTSTQLLREHPSRLGDVPRVPETNQISNFQNPYAAFQHWAAVVQVRSHNLPLCPQCHCPTPQGELQRWATCSICAVKKW